MRAMKCSVLGATGFIGSQLAEQLRLHGHECFAPDRDDPRVLSTPLGHVFYCIGVTADFRRRPFDTVRAHISVLADILERAQFDSLLYLSSTRVYARSQEGDEDAVLSALPNDASDYYNLTKMTGESLCFAAGRDNVRVARLSNVYGSDFASDNFLSSLVRAAVNEGSVLLETALESEKDYVSIADVVGVLPRIAFAGKQRTYNVASGANRTNAELLGALREASGCTFEVRSGAPTIRFPRISVVRLTREFDFAPASILDDLRSIVARYRSNRRDKH